jgi:hypothetical protein
MTEPPRPQFCYEHKRVPEAYCASCPGKPTFLCYTCICEHIKKNKGHTDICEISKLIEKEKENFDKNDKVAQERARLIQEYNLKAGRLYKDKEKVQAAMMEKLQEEENFYQRLRSDAFREQEQVELAFERLQNHLSICECQLKDRRKTSQELEASLRRQMAEHQYVAAYEEVESMISPEVPLSQRAIEIELETCSKKLAQYERLSRRANAAKDRTELMDKLSHTEGKIRYPPSSRTKTTAARLRALQREQGKNHPR